MSRARHAEVVGAGLAGLTAAIALATRGWSVRVHETASELRMFGAGIWLWENGLRVLETIGALEVTLAHSDQLSRWEIRDDRNRLLIARDFAGDDRLFIPPRAHLYDALVERAGSLEVEIETSSTAVSATPDGSLELEDGSVLGADLIVAADGHRSRIRESLGLTGRAFYKQEGCTRLLIPREPEDPASVATEYWRGHRRLLFCPSSDEVNYVCLVLRTSDEHGKAVPIEKETWVESFPHLETYIRRFGSEGRWDVLSHVDCKSWSAGKVAIVGDAAHAQPPNLGQGANLAFANALAMAVAVAESPDLSGALRAWEARERPLTDHTQKWTNIYGAIAEHWPARLHDVRSLAVWGTGRSAWLARQLNRAANSSPTGTEGLAEARATVEGL